MPLLRGITTDNVSVNVGCCLVLVFILVLFAETNIGINSNTLQIYYLFFSNIFLYLWNMSLKKFLEDNKIIKESALAALMWPDKKHSAKVFSNKINEVKAGSGKQRITEDDESRAKSVLLELSDRIKAFAGQKIEATKKDVKPVVKLKEQPKRLNLAEELERLRKEGK